MKSLTKCLNEAVVKNDNKKLKQMKDNDILTGIEILFDGYSKVFPEAAEIIYNIYKDELDDSWKMSEFLDHIAMTIEDKAKTLNDKDLQTLRSAFGNSALIK